MTPDQDTKVSAMIEALLDVLLMPPTPTDPPPICLQDTSIVDEENPSTCASTSIDVLSSVVPILPNSLDPPPLTCLRDASSVGVEKPSTNGQLHIEFSVIKIVTVIFVVVGVILPIVVIFHRDVYLGKIEAPIKRPDDFFDEPLKSLTSIARSLASAVTKVVDVALELITTVSLLCYAANWTIRRDASNLLQSMAPLLLTAAASYVVCSGPNAIVVQLKSVGYNTGIDQDDLSTRDSSKQTEDFVSLAYEPSCSEKASDNKVLNTILRTQLLQNENVKANCTGSKTNNVKPPRVSFDYTSSEWMIEALPMMLTPYKKAALLSKSSGAASIVNLDDKQFRARTLYTMALEQLYDKFKGLWDSDDSISRFLDDYYTKGTPSNRPLNNLMDFAGDNFVDESRDMLHNLLNKSSSIVADNVAAEYQIFQVSEKLEYKALTLTIPVKSRDEKYIIKDRCTPEGCVLEDETKVFGSPSAAIMPGVRVSALCDRNEHDEHVDKRYCNLVVVSIGKKVTGDGLLASSGNAVATGLQTVFTLTVGIMKWDLEDLGEIYNTTCRIEATNFDRDRCKGVRVETPALKEAGKVLLLSVDELYLSELSDLNDVLSASAWSEIYWKDIVKVEDAPAILLPRNFINVNGSFNTRFQGDCPYDIDQVIRKVLANHLYAEESLQMSYTSGMHFLFENGVLHNMYQYGDTTMVNFFGTIEQFHVQMSIPKYNAITSYIGCGFLVAVAIWIAVTHKRASRIIETEAANSATVIAEVMVNDDKYPRSMLKLSLDQPAPDGGSSCRTKLKNLELASTVFGSKPARLDRSAKLGKPHWPAKLDHPHWVTKLIKSTKSNTSAHENTTAVQGDGSSSTSGSDPSSGEASTHSAA